MAFIYQQLSAFTILLIAGLALGAFFDLYRVFRSRIKVNAFIDGIGDIVFWVISLIMMIPLLYWGAWLELRLYVWIAMVLGVLGYFFIFSRVCIPVYRRFWIVVMWLPKLMFNIVYGIALRLSRLFWQRSIKQKRIRSAQRENGLSHPKK